MDESMRLHSGSRYTERMLLSSSLDWFTCSYLTETPNSWSHTQREP